MREQKVIYIQIILQYLYSKVLAARFGLLVLVSQLTRPLLYCSW